MNKSKLFNETQSEHFLTLCSVINDIHRGSLLTETDILHRFPHIDWADKDRLLQLLHTVFIFDEKGHARLFINAPIPQLATHYQLRWLKDMLLNPECDFLLADQIRIKLLAAMKDINPLTNPETITIFRETGDRNLHLANSDMLAKIWQALKNRQKLAYTYQDAGGNIHQGICPPCRLEYDCAWHRLHLILWLEKEQRAIKLNISGIQEISLTDISYGREIEQYFEDFLARNKTSVVLQLSPKNNAVDRCFAIFSSYDKQSVYDEDNDIYTLTITYYQFDREEIINYILSLGAAVTVMAPQDMRQSVIDRLKAQWQLLSATPDTPSPEAD